jgi:ABC-type amino acid transport substrate-binding protein
MYKLKIKINILLAFLLLNFSIFGEEFNIIYFDPDGNLRNITSLQSEGNKYFQTISPDINFFVIASEQILNTEMERLKPQFMIVQSLYYSRQKASLALRPYFIFLTKENYFYYKKIITMNPEIKSLEDLDKKVVASALPKEITKELTGGERNWKLLTVPKDMDALMALKFKQADAALVAESSLESFKKLDPNDSQSINPIFTTKSIFLPLGVSTKYTTNKETVIKLTEYMKKIKTDVNASSFIKMMNFDDISDSKKTLGMVP